MDRVERSIHAAEALHTDFQSCARLLQAGRGTCLTNNLAITAYGTLILIHTPSDAER